MKDIVIEERGNLRLPSRSDARVRALVLLSTELPHTLCIFIQNILNRFAHTDAINSTPLHYPNTLGGHFSKPVRIIDCSDYRMKDLSIEERGNRMKDFN